MTKNIKTLKQQAIETNKSACKWFENYMQELVYSTPGVYKIEYAMGTFLVYGSDKTLVDTNDSIYMLLHDEMTKIEDIFGPIFPSSTERTYRDYNSSINQEIKGKFVEREVMANVGTMVEFILNCKINRAPFTLEDIDNFWQYPEYSHKDTGEYFVGGTDEVLEDEKERVNDIVADLEDADPEDPKIDQYNDYLAELERLETEPAEIYEWWMVTGWLAEKLQEKGECIIPDFNLWGRCTTGQAILLDGVICSICEDMEILEGQKNAWK